MIPRRCVLPVHLSGGRCGPRTTNANVGSKYLELEAQHLVRDSLDPRLNVLIFLMVLVSVTLPSACGQTTLSIPITGSAVPGMESYDQTMTAILSKYAIPGAELAVAYNGRLVYSRGFGYADLDTKQLVEPYSLFRQHLQIVYGGGHHEARRRRQAKS